MTKRPIIKPAHRQTTKPTFPKGTFTNYIDPSSQIRKARESRRSKRLNK